MNNQIFDAIAIEMNITNENVKNITNVQRLTIIMKYAHKLLKQKSCETFAMCLKYAHDMYKKIVTYIKINIAIANNKLIHVDELKQMLKTQFVEFVFVKIDNSLRYVNATLNAKLIQKYVKNEKNETLKQQKNYTNLRFFDKTCNDFRACSKNTQFVYIV